MGMNFYACCHKCKMRLFLYRGKESKPMRAFWRDHEKCIRQNKDACEVRGDGYGEQDWMSSYEEISKEPEHEQRKERDMKRPELPSKWLKREIEKLETTTDIKEIARATARILETHNAIIDYVKWIEEQCKR